MTDLTIKNNTPIQEAVSDEMMGFVEQIRKASDDLKEINLGRFGLGAWSISKLKVLQKCPFQFYLKYVLKIKVPENLAVKSDPLSANVGSAAHRILEFVMKGKSIQDSYALTKKEFVPDKLTGENWAELVETLFMSISNFKDRMDSFSRLNPVKRIFTEMRMGVTKDWEACAFFDDDVYFRGIIDLALQLENNDLIIIDHKTGGGEGSIRPYEAQLNSYKPLFHYGMMPIEGAQAGIHFIRAGDVRMARYHDKSQVTKDLVTALEWDIDGAIDSVKETGYFKHICANQCKWCDYSSFCKHEKKLLKPIELSTKKFIPIVKV